MTLTFQDIKNAKPEAEPYKLADSRGLFLLVLPTGFKSWRYKYRFADKEKLLILGQFPDLGLGDRRRRSQMSVRQDRSQRDLDTISHDPHGESADGLRDGCLLWLPGTYFDQALVERAFDASVFDEAV